MILDEEQLAVRALPGQEPGESLFAGSSKDEVRVGHVGCVQILPEERRCEATRPYRTGDNSLHRVKNLVLPAIVDRDAEGAPSIPLREPLGLPERIP